MFITALSVLAMSSALEAPTTLERKFVKGTAYNYTYKSHLLEETSSTGSINNLPEEVDFLYKFTAKVTDVQPSGFATIDYLRPKMTQIDGETAEHPPVSHDLPIKMHLSMQLSPINEVTDVKDLEPKKDEPPKKGKGGWTVPVYEVTPQQFEPPFLQEMEKMSLFLGSPIDGLDFSPKLPLEPVKVGDTWKRTVSYQPQALAGGKGKQAVQRVDLVYKYLGPKFEAGKDFIAIQATIHIDTDATKFVADELGVKVEESPVKEMKIKVDTVFNYKLDPNDLHTLTIDGATNGQYNLLVQRGQRQLEFERKVTAKTTLVQN